MDDAVSRTIVVFPENSLFEVARLIIACLRCANFGWVGVGQESI